MHSAHRQNNFNLIRLVLALLVILSHSPCLIDGNGDAREPLMQVFGTLSLGELAVDGFFLLSGYLIMQSWVSQPQAWPFLKKRALRIYPGFIVACLVSAFIVGPLGADPAVYFNAFDMTAFVKGLLFLNIPAVPAVFAGTHYDIVNGSMWTICKEFSCYLLVLAAGVTGALRWRHFCLAAATGVFLSFAWLKFKFEPAGDLRLATFFLSGACYYVYRDQIRFKGVALGAAGVFVAFFMFSGRGAELALASAGGYLLLFVAGKRSALLSRFNRLPDVSYGVYLYGWPIQKLLLWYYPSMSPWTLFALSAPASIVCGIASWYLVEKPALRFKGPSLQVATQEREPVPT